VPRLERLEPEIQRRREIVELYRELLAGVDAADVLYPDAELEPSSCYLMAVGVDPEVRRELRVTLRETHGVMTTVFPAVHQLSAYAEEARSLPRSEQAAASHVVLPLHPHLSDDDVRRVVGALADALATA
jgi:dTDP-4-amino-4,6-dideoxygalactose transaminase